MTGEIDTATWSSTLAPLTGSDRIDLIEDAVKHERWYSSLASLKDLDYCQLNNLVSDVLIALANLLGEVEDGVRWAHAHADDLLAQQRRSAVDELVTVLTLGSAARQHDQWLDPRYVALLETDHAPVSTYARAIGQALAAVEPPRAAAFLDAHAVGGGRAGPGPGLASRCPRHSRAPGQR